MSLRVDDRTRTVAFFGFRLVAPEILSLGAGRDKRHARGERFINFDTVLLVADRRRIGNALRRRRVFRRRDISVSQLKKSAKIAQTGNRSDRDERRSKC